MKIEEGFNPKAAKEEALDRAEAEEREGSAHPLTPAYNREQRGELQRIIAELEWIVTDLEKDADKVRGYAGELEEALEDLRLLPQDDRAHPAEAALASAQKASLAGQGVQTVECLRRCLGEARAHLRAIEQG